MVGRGSSLGNVVLDGRSCRHYISQKAAGARARGRSRRSAARKCTSSGAARGRCLNASGVLRCALGEDQESRKRALEPDGPTCTWSPPHTACVTATAVASVRSASMRWLCPAAAHLPLYSFHPSEFGLNHSCLVPWPPPSPVRRSAAIGATPSFRASGLYQPPHHAGAPLTSPSLTVAF